MKKLNKKGFTLIELLAVIAILAILIVISVPGVLTMYNSGKKSAFETQAKNIWSLIETQLINDNIKPEVGPYTEYCYDGTPTDDSTAVGKITLNSDNYYYKATISNTGISSIQVQQVSGTKIVFSTANNITSQAGLVVDDTLTGTITSLKCIARS